MNFLQLAKQRYSCRQLTDKNIEPEKLSRILQAANLAPTAVNKQPFKIWVITSEAFVKHIYDTCKYCFGAKTFIVVGAYPTEAWIRKFDSHNFAEVDATIAATHIMMQIQEEGLATTWVACFDAPELKKRCPQFENHELIAIFPIGYAAKDATPSPKHEQRKSLEQLVTTL